MNFKWEMLKDNNATFEDRVHNLACFEIVLNIFRMKTKSGEDDVSEEMQALCGFALECMFVDTDLTDDGVFEAIMQLKDKKVNKFRASLFEDMGVPKEIMDSTDVGEA